MTGPMAMVFPLDDLRVAATCWTNHQHVAYTYAVDSVLPLLSADGIWFASHPYSPLDTEEVVQVFREIVKHENYERQKLNLADRLGQRIEYDPNTGLITIDCFPQPPERNN